jgi:hypothetical protein
MAALTVDVGFVNDAVGENDCFAAVVHTLAQATAGSDRWIEKRFLAFATAGFSRTGEHTTNIEDSGQPEISATFCALLDCG